MKRVVIFAHYDKQNIIDPYVIDYLKELRKYSEIIFVSDGDLSRQEISKVKDLCFDNICKKHGESNDFGSYKKGFILLKEKYSQKFNSLDEVLFVNDSCYLVGKFETIFNDMEENTEIDFWGLTDNHVSFDNPEYHIQSYFLSFRKNVYLDNDFHIFIKNIKSEINKKNIIDNYEIGLSKLLYKKNKNILCYFSTYNIDRYIIENKFELFKDIKKIHKEHSLFYIDNVNYAYSDKFYILLLCGFPLLKVSLLDQNISYGDKLTFFWSEIITKLNINDKSKIVNHKKRLGHKIKSPYIGCIEKKKESLHIKLPEIHINICGKRILNIKISNYFRLKLFGIRILKTKL
jgi:hypothetical protein